MNVQSVNEQNRDMSIKQARFEKYSANAEKVVSGDQGEFMWQDIYHPPNDIANNLIISIVSHLALIIFQQRRRNS